MKTLKIDNKWSIEYDPDNNDRPVLWSRSGEPWRNWDENNAVTAMFYTLLETQPAQPIEAKPVIVQLAVSLVRSAISVGADEIKLTLDRGELDGEETGPWELRATLIKDEPA